MRSISTTLRLLEAICSEKPGVTISQLASLTKQSPSNICYYMKILQQEGYVYKDAHSGRYKASYKIADLGSRILANNELCEIAYPVLLKLSEEAQLTVHMAIREENMGVCISKVGSSKTMPSISRIGEIFDLYPTALGKAMLAWLSEEDLDEYLEQTRLKPYTPRTVTNPEKLKEQLARFRIQGYTLDEYEHTLRVRGIGVPVFDYTGKVVAAISALLLPYHTDADIKCIASKMKTAANEISRKLGYNGDTQVHMN